MSTKAIKGKAKLIMQAGVAKPNPQMGQALGPLGLNMMQLCKAFNEQSLKTYRSEVPLRVRVTAYEDRTYDMSVKAPPTSYLLKKAAGVEKGIDQPGRGVIGEIDARQIYWIAMIKKRDPGMENRSLEGLCKSIAGTARCIGLNIVD